MTLTSEASIAAMLKEHGSGLSPDNYDATKEAETLRQRRADMLADVLATCKSDFFTLEFESIAASLGDGSRDGAWRLPYGDSGILDFFLKLLTEDDLKPAIAIHSLRIVGNSCADTEENRARVLQGDHLATIIRRVQDVSLLPYTIAVLYNILLDYAPAQLAASQANLSGLLVTLLRSPKFTPDHYPLAHICNVLALIVSQEGESVVASQETVHVLLDLATHHPELKTDVEAFNSLVSIAAKYLNLEKFQQLIVASPDLGLLLNTLHHAYTVFETSELDDPDVSEALTQVRTDINKAISEVTGHDLFVENYSFGSPVIETLVSWLRGSVSGLKPAACQALGNFTRSHKTATVLVHECRIHEPIVNLIIDLATNDANLLHSTCGFLKNLAVPDQNKPVLGIVLEPLCVPRIYSMDTRPEVQFAAISLTRLLLKECPDNVRRICSVWNNDVSSPSKDRTSLQHIISLFDRTNTEPTKLEAARCILNICRVLHSNPVQSILIDWTPANTPEGTNDSMRREHFYSSHDLVKPLSLLLTHGKWPSLRTEACFVFALMSRSKEGGSVVHSVLNNEGAMAALTEAVIGTTGPTDSTSPATGAMMPMVDGIEPEPQQVSPELQAAATTSAHENGVVLCTELIRNCADDISQETLSKLQELVILGTKFIMEERAQKA